MTDIDLFQNSDITFIQEEDDDIIVTGEESLVITPTQIETSFSLIIPPGNAKLTSVAPTRTP